MAIGESVIMTGIQKMSQKAEQQQAAQMQELNANLQQLAELLNDVIDRENNIIEGIVSNYEAIKSIAEKTGTTLPEPKWDMTLEE